MEDIPSAAGNGALLQSAISEAPSEALHERHRQSPEDYAAAVAEYKRRQWEDLSSGRRQASSVRRTDDLDKETGAHTVRTRRRGGAWSAPEATPPEAIELERRHSPTWAETERLARAALQGLHRAWRQARLHVFRTSLSLSRSRGPRRRARSRRVARRPSCRSRAPSDADDGDSDGDPPRALRDAARPAVPAVRAGASR
jgi:hypothetical protein